MYSVSNIKTKEKFENTLRDFGVYGEYFYKSEQELEVEPLGGGRICWSDNKTILKDNDEVMEFDTISLISDEEYQMLMDGLQDKESFLVYKWIKLMDSTSGNTKYVLIQKNHLIGEASFAELLQLHNGKVPFNMMPHRNLYLYITVDENGNHIKHAEKIDKDKPVNSAGLSRDWFDDESILVDDGQFHYSVNTRDVVEKLQAYIKKGEMI